MRTSVSTIPSWPAARRPVCYVRSLRACRWVSAVGGLPLFSSDTKFESGTGTRPCSEDPVNVTHGPLHFQLILQR